MTDIEALRASMRSAQLTGQGNYLLAGVHTCKIEKFFFKGPGPKNPIGAFICEFKPIQSTNPEMTAELTRSEMFDLTKQGWLERMKKFLLAALGVDWQGAVTEEQHDLVADIRFAAQFESERVKLTAKYGVEPQSFLVGRPVLAECAPYTAKSGKTIVAATWKPVKQ